MDTETSEDTFLPLQDSSSIASEISALMWVDDTVPNNENNIEAISWTSTNTIEPTEVASYFVNDFATRAEVRLRYLLQLFLEAGCLGWSAIIAVVLRDVSAIARTVRAAHGPMQTAESTNNLLDGLLKLINWSYSECLGYKEFLLSIQDQIVLLQKLVSEKQQSQLENHQLQEQESKSEHNVTGCTAPHVGNISSSHSHHSSTNCLLSTSTYSAENINQYPWRNDDNYCIRNNEETDAKGSNSTCTLS